MSAAARLNAEHQALLAAFLAEESARGRRPRGVECLSQRVPWFLFFLEERGKRAEETTQMDAREYQGSLLEGSTKSGAAYATHTIASYVGAASAFCEWLMLSGRLLANPFAGVYRVRREERVRSGILKEREMERLLTELANWKTQKDLKAMSRRYTTHVIAELQYASGLRIAEVASLKPSDVDVERAMVHVRDGKHGSSRIGFLTDYAASVLELYIQRMRPVMGNAQRCRHAERLFFTSYAWLQVAVNAELERACAEAGVQKITSHGFRHALGYHLLRSGCPLRYIQAILGHKHLKDAETYTRIDADDVKTVFDACHPRMHG